MKNSWTGGAAQQQWSDDGLALSVHRLEPGAFDRLVERFERPLLSYIQRLLQNLADAQEVVQDTFIRAHRALTRQYTTERCRDLALRPWLFRIARNLARNKQRGLRPRVEAPLPATDREQFRPLVHPSSFTSQLEMREDLARLDQAIALLPPESRELIVLRFIEEMSYAEISRTIGANEAALRGKVFRSLKLLREALTERGVANAM